MKVCLTSESYNCLPQALTMMLTMMMMHMPHISLYQKDRVKVLEAEIAVVRKVSEVIHPIFLSSFFFAHLYISVFYETSSWLHRYHRSMISSIRYIILSLVALL